MINESEKGYEVPVPGAQEFIPARTMEEAEGVLAGLQGATEKSNPYLHQPTATGEKCREYWRWEAGRKKAEEYIESLPQDGDKTNRRTGFILCLLSALFVIADILAVTGILPNWSL